jgi:hypothetical protein
VVRKLVDDSNPPMRKANCTTSGDHHPPPVYAARMLKDSKSKAGKTFDARLKLENGVVRFIRESSTVIAAGAVRDVHSTSG